MYIENHGVGQAHIKQVYELAQKNFNLPQSEKNKLNIVNSGPTLRGYIPMYGENVNPYNTQDFKECLDYGKHSDAVAPFFGPNLMPDKPKNFKQVLEKYHDIMLNLAYKLVEAIALSLDLPQDYFTKLQKNPITIARILRYPPQSGEISEKEIGIGAHTDYGFLTILSQDKNGGLQVQNAKKEWINAPPIDNTFVINIGDLVQTFTNDKYISTIHRVINASGKERFSIPFFLDMDFNAEIKPVTTCVSKTNPAKYQPYTCGQHKYKRFSDSYAHLSKY